MKKFFTLFAVLATALAASAQEPLFSFKTKVIADAEWGVEYASSFAFQGTEVTVDVYEDDYVIIRNWAGAEGCDLKVEYDSGADIDSDDCYGNIFAITAYINGEEQTPLTYSKDETDEESGETYTYQYFDFATGRADYPICSSTMNEDGTFYWSFVEVDKENQTGYIELSYLYFMTADYSANMDEQHYYVEWPMAAGPTYIGTYTNGTTDEVTDDDGNVDSSYGKAFMVGLTDITVEVYDEYVIIYDWSKNPASPRNLKVTCSHDENQQMTSLVYTNTTTAAESTITNGKFVYTGYEWNGEDYLYDVYAYPTGGYSLADWDEEGGYIILTGYPYYVNEEGKGAYGSSGYYYLYWGYEDEDDAVSAVKAAVARTTVYNLAGQRVKNAAKGVYIVNGKKVVLK